MRVTVYGHTEKGPRHEENEDVILVGHNVCTSGEAEAHMDDAPGDTFATGMLVAVADGMGSDALGAEAARLTLETLEDAFYADARDPNLRFLVNVLYNAAHRVNAIVLGYGEQQDVYAGMACTLTGVVMLRDEYFVFNAGDSRVYRFSQGVLRQMTDDDSLVAEAVSLGYMTPAEAEVSEFKHYVTNAVGSRTFQLRLSETQSMRPGDSLLLCSDGLHNVMNFAQMEQLLSAHGSAKERCRALLATASKSGEYDDLSIVVINVGDEVPAGDSING